MIHRLNRPAISGLMLVAMVVGVATAEPLPRRGLMGVMIQPVNDQMRERLGLDSAQGVLIASTRPNSPASKAGLEASDVIVRVSDAACPSIPALQQLMRRYYAGHTVKLTVVREGARRTVELTLMERPRETSDQYDLIYDAVTTDGGRVRTILTRPKGQAKSPAVLFIQGLSPQSVEVGMFPNHPYKSLIEGLNEAGFATMRVERLGLGDSEGRDVSATTVTDDVASFRKALAKLGTYDFVDESRVFVLSHATGGAIAPLVAAGSDARGVITWAALANPLTEVVPALMRKRWKLEVRADEQIEKFASRIDTFVKHCLVQGQSPAEVFQSHPGAEEVVRPVMQGENLVLGTDYRYWQQLAALDVPHEWSRVDVPVLALWGASDFNALRRCSELIARTVNKMHEGKATFEVVEGVDHLWQPAEDMEESYLMGFTGEFSPKVIEVITEWLKKTS